MPELSDSPARPQTSRRTRTERQLQDLIGAAGPITRSQLGARTGLSRTAVTEAVQRLLAAGVVSESGGGDSRPGRPAGRLVVVPPAGTVIGIDFGHAHVAVALADSSGTVLAERRQGIDVDVRPGQALDAGAGLAADLLAGAGRSARELLAVGAGIPGPLDRATRRVSSPTILRQWLDLDPRAELEARIGAPVVVHNDANLGALAEHRFGAGRRYQDLVYVKSSHGVGAGLVLGGRIYAGAAGMAGEIGHTQLPGATNWCRCGSRGCLETVVSVAEIRRQLALVGGVDRSADGALVLAVATAHPAAAKVIVEAGRALGRVLADIVNCLDPAGIVLGGELGTAGAPLVAGVRESIDRYAQSAAAAAVTIHPAALGLRAELVGAIAIAADRARARSVEDDRYRSGHGPVTTG